MASAVELPASATAVIELPAAVVTLIVPPPERFKPPAFDVVTASVAKVSVAPVLVPDQWTASPFAVVLLTVAPPAKLMEVPLAAFAISIGSLVLLRVAAPLTVTLPPPAPCRKASPDPPETPSVPKVRVPEELFWKLTPSVPPVTLVLPKLMAAVVVPTSMPCVVEPETVVEPNETVPAMPARLMPCAALDVVVTLEKAEVAANVPVERLSA